MAANLAQCWSSTGWLKVELTLQLGLAVGAGLCPSISCCRILSLSSPASDEEGSLYLGYGLFDMYFCDMGGDSVNSFRVYPRGMLGSGEAPCPLCLPLLKWLSVCLGYSSCAVHIIIPCSHSGTVFGEHHVDSLLMFIFIINVSFVSCEPWTFLLSRSYQLWKIYK